MWDLPGSGLKPVSPALAGGFLTTVPPGKSLKVIFKHKLEGVDVVACVPVCGKKVPGGVRVDGKCRGPELGLAAKATLQDSEEGRAAGGEGGESRGK